MTFYRDDLAFVHDDGFGHVAHAAADYLLTHLLPPAQTSTLQNTQPQEQAGTRASLDPSAESRDPTSTLVVDLGCGTGILAERLTAAGHNVLGCDISRGMINIAKKRAPQARFHLGSFLDFPLPRCRAVTSISECFNYAFDESNNLERLEELFSRIYEALETDGFLVFDVLQPGVLPVGEVVQRFRQADNWTVIVELQEDRAERLLTRRITTFRKVGQHYRRDDEIHRARLLEGTDVVAALGRVGFVVTRLDGYGTHRFSGTQTGFFARKTKAR